MSDAANVLSLDRLGQFGEVTGRFRTQLMQELESLQVELRKIEAWIASEALEYWLHESRLAERRWAECEQALSRCLSYVREQERRPCTEEKKRLQRAVARREMCTQQLRAVKAATAVWDREQQKIRTKVERCYDFADAQLLAALHELSSKLEQLENYAGLKHSAPRNAALDNSAAQSPLSRATERESLRGDASDPNSRFRDRQAGDQEPSEESRRQEPEQ